MGFVLGKPLGHTCPTFREAPSFSRVSRGLARKEMTDRERRVAKGRVGENKIGFCHSFRSAPSHSSIFRPYLLFLPLAVGINHVPRFRFHLLQL